MLVLTRKPGERLLIGDDIVVHVVRCSNGGVRLGIDAPRGLAVVRPEADARRLARARAAEEADAAAPAA